MPMPWPICFVLIWRISAGAEMTTTAATDTSLAYGAGEGADGGRVTRRAVTQLSGILAYWPGGCPTWRLKAVLKVLAEP